MAWNAYLALLGIWVLFVPAALAPAHGARRWARTAASLGLAGALYEAWMTFVWGPTVVGPIRIDIFLLFALLTGVYLGACRSLLRDGWRRSGLAAGVLTLAAAGVMGAEMLKVGREGDRLDDLRTEGNRLLFAAKFANQDAYDAYFGATEGAAGSLPVGHWESEERAPLTRLVVGADARAYLFFGCGDTECQFGPGAPLEPRDGSRVAQLVWRGVGERTLALSAAEGDALPIRLDGKPYRLRRSPPPLLGLTPPERLRYLGAFSATDPIRQHVRVSQLWLWQEEDSLYAVGIFQILLPGRRADFVTPQVMGRGTREGDAWRFTWEEAGDTPETRQAVVRLLEPGAGAEMTLPGREDLWPPQRLVPGAFFQDDAVELASRSSAADWQHWVDTLLAQHFSSGDVPAADAPQDRMR